ncbi:hypothetical protein PHYSODRAFT_333483 [Phytophthora sojae]|uniref:RxLR effector protein n=1 Tax=Phytophthora sojae (strain P6497) TaxID=1094619 RepID=G4ZK93_PHYSP|nr:hypothetical protein PHYSODRAFT_333483 [Phytophthora sojae]EGZ15210.1 hypothetical protein PHYSODRAFT_333483 [Phytophthora sojae]|eukprot:XP_009528959.1 hypothetical protein PHYSODRAFT_333483 [Phytophthora sojae]
MNLRSLLSAAIAATALASSGAVSIDHNKVQPFAQPEATTVSEKAARLLYLMVSEEILALQDLIMWEQLTEEARTGLREANFGEKTKVQFIDANFEANLEKALPSLGYLFVGSDTGCHDAACLLLAPTQAGTPATDMLKEDVPGG